MGETDGGKLMPHVNMGALACCMFELYRKKIAKYEDEKIAENGEALGNLG